MWRRATALMVSEGAPALTGAFDALASRDALPAVFHCSAGKDRTGVLSALVLAFLGVPDETIVDDYALSGAGHGAPARPAEGGVPRLGGGGRAVRAGRPPGAARDHGGVPGLACGPSTAPTTRWPSPWGSPTPWPPCAGRVLVEA